MFANFLSAFLALIPYKTKSCITRLDTGIFFSDQRVYQKHINNYGPSFMNAIGQSGVQVLFIPTEFHGFF